MELPLLLALSSLGALYCFEKEHASKLHSIAADLLSQVGTLREVLTVDLITDEMRG
jgi:hypothetical protein